MRFSNGDQLLTTTIFMAKLIILISNDDLLNNRNLLDGNIRLLKNVHTLAFAGNHFLIANNQEFYKHVIS